MYLVIYNKNFEWIYVLFSLRMAVLLHKWEFIILRLDFWQWVKNFDHQDFQILKLGSSGTSWFWQLVQALLDIAKICIDVDICYGTEAFIMNKVLSLSLSKKTYIVGTHY